MMKMCSDKAYLKARSSVAQPKNEVDTNVVQIRFDNLKTMQVQIHQGDPIQCMQCQSVLNKHSIVTSNVLNNQFQQQQQQWVCEFCHKNNEVQIEKEELPMSDDVVYLVQSAQEFNHQQQQDNNVDQTVVFCIDNSGSMATTSEVKGNMNVKHGLSKQEYEMLKQFIDKGAEKQQMPKGKKNITYISRKQCLMAAIEQQITQIKQSQPNKIVGLVTFNNEVLIIGDGTQQPLTIAGDRLGQIDQIKAAVQQSANALLSKPISQCGDKLLQAFNKLQEIGQTALGPALLASLELAKLGKAGSMVILCTDGLANLGLGAMDGEQDATEFYSQLAKFAAENGIIVSLVTIKGEGCKIEILSQLIQQTNGTVTRVQPDQIGADFANILKDEVVGTHVELTIKLHRALKFRNEDDPNLTTTLFKKIGNVTINTIVTFEYQTKDDVELEQEHIQISNIKRIPFQVKILYIALNGDKYLRVITTMVDTTENLMEAEKGAKVDVIHSRIAQQTAGLAKKKQFGRASDFNQDWDQYVTTNNIINMNKDNVKKNATFSQRNSKLQTVVQKQSFRTEGKSGGISISAVKPTIGNKSGQIKQTNHNQQLTKAQKYKQQQKPSISQAQQLANNLKQKAQQKQLEVIEQPSESSESESDEDQEVADLMNFEQLKY